MFDQQRLRSACAYAQSDQSLYLSLEYSMTVKLQTEHHLEFLSVKEATQARLSLHLSNCHIVGNLMSPLKYSRKDKGYKSLWALTRENLSGEVYEQQRCRPACASAQSDQRICYSLFDKYHI